MGFDNRRRQGKKFGVEINVLKKKEMIVYLANAR